MQILNSRNKDRLNTLKSIFKLMLWYPVVALYPRNKKKILFGAWCGNQYSDNPKYFLKYIQSLNQGFECVWIGNECVRSKVEEDGIRFVLKGSKEARKHLLSAKWLVSNLGAECDVTAKFPTYGRIKQLTFWHGAAYKGVCHRDYHAELSKHPWHRLQQLFLSRDFSIATPLWSWASFSFEEMRHLMPFEVPWQFKTDMSIAAGTARIDYLIKNANSRDEISRVRQSISSVLSLPLNKKWYLYMPTWRKGKGLDYTLGNSLFFDNLNTVLTNQNAIIIEKQHPQVLQKNNIQGGWTKNVYIMPSDVGLTNIDTQELLLACDRLITDYSSCFCDFESMNRPVIHFAYDYDEYVSTERKEAHDIRKYAAGPIAYTEYELVEILKMKDSELLSRKGPNANELIEGETGHACDTFARWVGLIE